MNRAASLRHLSPARKLALVVVYTARALLMFAAAVIGFHWLWTGRPW